MDRHEWNIRCHLTNMKVGQVLAICVPECTYVLRLEEVRMNSTDTNGFNGIEPAMIWIDEVKEANNE